MAEEVVVGSTLTAEMIQSGADAVQQLDNVGFTADAAFWFYFPDSGQWRFALATPGVFADGPKRAYKRVQSALAEMPEPRLSLENVAIFDSTDPLITLLRSAIQTGSGISSIRFTRNTIGGIFIDDAYIYRLA